MTYETTVILRDSLESDYREACAAMRAFPHLPNGLTPDDVKRTPEWRAAKSRYESTFRALREVNAVIVKNRPRR